MIWNSQVDWHSSIAWLGPEMSRWQHVATEPKRHHLHHASLLQKLAFDFWSSSHFLSFLSLSQPGSFAFLDFHVPKACREREKIRVRWDLSSHDMISCETENAGKGWEIAIGIRMDMIWIWYGYDTNYAQENKDNVTAGCLTQTSAFVQCICSILPLVLRLSAQSCTYATYET